MKEVKDIYCRRCGNKEDTLFKKSKKGIYCVKCQRFGKYYLDNNNEKVFKTNTFNEANYELPYALTSKQQRCAEDVVMYIKKKEDVLVYAACGAGKTEMSMPLITYALESGLKIGIAIPRKDVVIELGVRYQEAFPKIKVVEVYGDHHNEIDGDLIIMTTHQLYRYEKVFDVLIIDEVDAFPFAGNEILENMVDYACKGNKVYLTATPSSKIKDMVKKGVIKQVALFVRPHGGKLCIPKVVIGFDWYLYVHMLRFFKKYKSKIILLFVPTKTLAYKMHRVLSLFRKTCVVTSESENRELLNIQIKNHEYDVVVCTTVLERGITIPDVQVIVFDATHPVFNEAALIQISGRVGRKEYAKEGECMLLCKKKSKVVDSVIESLEMMNDEQMCNM